MSVSDENIDAQIRREIARIKREAIAWEPPSQPDGKAALRWKPRSDMEHFVREGNKRLVPTDKQVYYDLQLSRGAARPLWENGEWEFNGPEDGLTTWREKNEERLAHYRRFMPLPPAARLLELGVRTGHFVYFLQKKGYQNAAGIDCVKLNVLSCRKYGLDVKLADAHELPAHFPPESFDAIFAYHVLEHCYEPAKVLQGCWEVLKPEGGLHVEIPVTELNQQTAHCYAFTRRELRKMLKKQRFRILNRVFFKNTAVERIVAKKAGPRAGCGTRPGAAAGWGIWSWLSAAREQLLGSVTK